MNVAPKMGGIEQAFANPEDFADQMAFASNTAACSAKISGHDP
jgi:hypothetical protein